jgi:hypothetical protein
MTDQQDTATLGFWASVTLAAIAAVLPFLPERWLPSVTGYVAIVGAPVLWLVGFWGASHSNRRRRWLLFFAAPFALRSVVEAIVTSVLWLARG